VAGELTRVRDETGEVLEVERLDGGQYLHVDE